METSEKNNKNNKRTPRRYNLHSAYFAIFCLGALATAFLFYFFGRNEWLIAAFGAAVAVLIIGVASLYGIFNAYNLRVKRLRAAVSKAEEGDLQTIAHDTENDELSRLAADINRMIQTNHARVGMMTDVSEKVKNASQTIAANVEEHRASSSEIGSAMSEIAAGASDQAELMSKNKQATDQLKERTNEIEEQTALMSTGAEQLIDVSDRNKQSVTKLRKHSERTISATADIIDAIASLEARSKNVGQIITDVSEIAGQTNLLALNAAIEAARAGEQGKGFAVVADEVRKLSEQTDQALNEISELINGIRADTAHTVTFAGKTSKVLEEQFVVVADFEKASAQITEAVAENRKQIGMITASIKEMSERTQEIKTTIDGMAQISEQNAAGTEQATASIEEQTAGLDHLSKLAADLESDAEAIRAMLCSDRQTK
ncbi:methyl-accepting chemotaxis protein [Sporolactobacillus terrae]|uniref:Uncharacterized protein n=1 Tax=Sporolactobacillus terrae TaxID=269673 RepID=A0A5K7WU35_9BACL|nr:methyl-accepting chemotaxis protein [Sporolactobacillus terrae]UAK16706.1 HAMP domain-containing protein [Sporolactobacillus terrae]BBN98191.1 hypothetical protein St703_08960 [Sporolactobacillus terrae]